MINVSVSTSKEFYCIGDSGKATNKFVILYSKNIDKHSSKSVDEFEVKLDSPNLTSGITASRSVTQSGDVTETNVVASIFGLNQKADFTFEQLASPEAVNRKLELKTSLKLAKHIRVEIDTKNEVRHFHSF